MWWLTPEEIEEWWEFKEAWEKGQQLRCGGCGKFLPKSLNGEAWLILGGEVYHMKEKCITKGVEKRRKNRPDWNWPLMRFRNGS